MKQTMKYEGYVACRGKWDMHSFCLGNQNGKTLEDQSI